MIRPGVWRPEQFYAQPPPGWKNRLYHALSRTRVGYHLLAIPERPGPADIQFFERLLPYVCLSSGVYRTTYRQRFKNFNPQINQILARHFASSEKLLVEDWAASDCLTSAEWTQELLPQFPHLHFTASDLLLFLAEARETNTQKRWIWEPGGQPLQYIQPPFVIRLSQPESPVFLFNWLLYRSALRRWQKIKKELPLPAAWQETLGAAPLSLNRFTVRQLSLIHPEAVGLMEKDKRFTIRRHSIFQPSEKVNHVVRSMNIYNRAYFSEEQLREGVRCVAKSLLPGGLWIVGRTIDKEASVHEVSVLQKDDSGFQVISRVGPGSEIEDLAVATSLPAGVTHA